MRTSNFTTSERYPYPLEDVFSFFAEAENLEAITPPWLEFRLASPGPILMGVGTRIDYDLRFRRVPIRWRSEITVWEPPLRFVDEQIRGPYRRWVHIHTFTPVDDGTLVHDHVEYAVPGGRVIERFVVRRDIERIFDYRSQALDVIFGDTAASNIKLSRDSSLVR
jgi:ligand-binding SRPBCC domain-containing protein